MNERIVVAKCANRSEAEQVQETLRAAGIESIVEDHEGVKVAVADEALEAALDLLAQLPEERKRTPGPVGRQSLEWTGRCPACGSMKIAPVEGAFTAAALVLLALEAVTYAGARQIHLRHPVLDSLALVPLMLVVSWIVFRRTPNARCDSCNTYWKARR